MKLIVYNLFLSSKDLGSFAMPFLESEEHMEELDGEKKPLVTSGGSPSGSSSPQSPLETRRYTFPSNPNKHVSIAVSFLVNLEFLFIIFM